MQDNTKMKEGSHKMEYLKNICRTCAYEHDVLYDIPEDKDFNYMQFLESFGNIVIHCGDGAPHQMCPSCIAKLNQCIEFKLQIEKADVSLKNILKTRQVETVEVKVDVPEYDNDDKTKLFLATVDDLSRDDDYDSSDYEPIAKKDKITLGTQQELKKETKCPVVAFLHICRRCDTCFHSFDDLTLHNNQQHDKLTAEEWLTCRFCKRLFVHRRHIPIHIRRHHNHEIKYKCGYCDSVYDDEKEVKKHIGLHVDVDKADEFAALEISQVKKSTVKKKKKRRNGQNKSTPDIDKPLDMKDMRPMPTEDNAIIFCSVCRRFFANIESLNQHMLEGHSPNLEVLADGEGWIATVKTQEEVTMKEEERPFACRLCGKRYIHLRDMRRHETAHDPDKPFFCKFGLCRWAFPTDEELSVHVMVNHSGNAECTCPVCFKQFKAKRLLGQHMKSHGNRERFKCKFCGKGFNYRIHLNNHEVTHTKETPYLCQQCGKGFAVKENFRLHTLRHNKQLPHACHICSKSFLLPSKLKVHMKIHSGETDYLCQTCGLQMKTPAELSRHNQIHMENEHTRHCCVACMRYFKKKTAYEFHMKSHENGARVHKCSECPWMFTSTQLLRDHVANRHSNKVRNRKLGIFCGVPSSPSGKHSIKTEHLMNKEVASDDRSVHSDVSNHDTTIAMESHSHKELCKPELNRNNIYPESQGEITNLELVRNFSKSEIEKTEPKPRMLRNGSDPEQRTAVGSSEIKDEMSPVANVEITISENNQVYIVPTYYGKSVK